MIPAHANGSSAGSGSRAGTRSPLATAVAIRRHEPLEAVLGLGRKASQAITVALVLAVAFHGTAAARAASLPLDFMRWSRDVGQHIHDRLWETYEIDVVKPPPEPEAPPPPPAEEAKDEPKEAPPPPSHAAKEAPPPPPAAAQASAVLTKEADPNEPVDLTGEGFVTGTGSSFAGGITQQGGTSESAVYNRNARAGGVPGGQGAPRAAAPAPTGPDRARPAGLSGSSDWKCPWPSEADAEQIDEAYVSVQVTTRADGSAQSVSILSDPGHGFAREARGCAMREHFTAALDHDGNAIPGVTKVFKIHFER